MSSSPRVALVTGAASGIGAAIARRLRASGYELLVVDRSEAPLRDLADELEARALPVDVRDDRAVRELLQPLDRLDVLINAAGIATESTIDDLVAYQDTIDVNLTGMVTVANASVALLRRSSAGRILNIGSVQGEVAARSSLAYVVSKSGVHGLTRALAVDLAPQGILVNALAPGFIDTPMAVLPDGRTEYETEWFRDVYVGHGRIPLRRPGTPEEVAYAAEFLVSPHNGYITGAVLPVDGGLTATF